MSLTRFESSSANELISIITNKAAPREDVYCAYLTLICQGNIEAVKQYKDCMDFSFNDEDGNSAFRLAAIYGYINILNWLHEEIHEFRNIDERARAYIILAAAASNQCSVLHHFSEPKSGGGFGWDLNVEIENGATPVTFAHKYNRYRMVMALLQSKHKGGFGLPLHKKQLRMIFNNPELNLFSSGLVPSYQRRKPTRKISTLSLANNKMNDSSIDLVKKDYQPVEVLGSGSFGTVRKFALTTNADDVVVVKKPNTQTKPLSSLGVFARAQTAVAEVKYLQRAYPHESPYKLKHYLSRDGRQYSNVMALPMVDGERLESAVLNTQCVGDLARLILAVITEIHRIHQLGIVHGDPHIKNYLILTERDANQSLVYRVHFIDFAFAADVGSKIPSFDSKADFIAPELYADPNADVVAHPAQDIFAIGYILNKYARWFLEDMKKDFPTTLEYLDKCISISPEKRPDLDDFIRALKAELNEYENGCDDEPDNDLMKCN